MRTSEDAQILTSSAQPHAWRITCSPVAFVLFARTAIARAGSGPVWTRACIVLVSRAQFDMKSPMYHKTSFARHVYELQGLV